jgi:Family of unknown function (DUF6510)
MDSDALVLDGNAVAGLLAEVFGAEMTVSHCACAGCGLVEQLGGERAYVHAPGVVIRCRGCEAVLMVVVEVRGRFRLALQGLSWIDLDPR